MPLRTFAVVFAPRPEDVQARHVDRGGRDPRSTLTISQRVGKIPQRRGSVRGRAPGAAGTATP
jgi:hypothetical protein